MRSASPTESQEQAALFEWAELVKRKHPELAMMFHIPNGGSRNVIEAAHLKAQGVKAGVPDICLPVARGPYHALYIELKRKKTGKVRIEQNRWIKALNDQGNLAVVCWGMEAAQQTIISYLNLKGARHEEITLPDLHGPDADMPRTMRELPQMGRRGSGAEPGKPHDPRRRRTHQAQPRKD